jgi:sarcosine oxidase subunit alpha
MRLGFVGELSYELHVPSSYMQSLWALLEESGREFDINPFGLEAQNVLRMEKGHLIIGSESEQRTTLHDVGLGFIWDRNKPKAETVGAMALMHTEKQEGRLKRVGFKVKDAQRAPRDGSIVVNQDMCGYVCIARYSYTLQQIVGMALVKDYLSSEGATLDIYEDECEGRLIHADVVKMPFYDAQGKRLRM